MNTFRCEQCGQEIDEKPIIIRFSYYLVDGTPGVVLIYLCSGCDMQFPKKNPTRRNQLVQLFKSLYPTRELRPETDKSSG